MGKELIKQIEGGMKTSFIDRDITSDPYFRPQLLTNDYKEGKKVLSSLQDELSRCDEFYISVAFITMGGIEPLLLILKELENAGVKGKILTTDYLTFSDPKALIKLNELTNIEIKMYVTEGEKEGFHTKGYIFKNIATETFRIITGSANITQSALSINKEWNTRIVSTKDGEYAQAILDEFHQLWTSDKTKAFHDFIYEYETKYRLVKEQKSIVRDTRVPQMVNYNLKPNSMQVGFINNLMKLREQGAEKALLISATGTGKTYASAFAIREMRPNRILFLVHREQIARQAKESFSKVFDEHIKMGIISGNSFESGHQFIFSTMQMMAKEEIRHKFRRDEFDVIIIDEVHRAGAESYQKIIDYFKPTLYLGMTASPERMDGFDIYKLFDHNIAYEIRLQEALEEDLLCPFHYFGITDFGVEEDSLRSANQLRDFQYLVQDERVNYILEKIRYYGHSGERVKGLIFCSSKQEARELSVKFNQQGYRTLVLTGDDSQEKRIEAIERLTCDASEGCLDYIFTVDIFNEGVDIPEINQVVMLRPTQSPTIFIQQLGRGLRKYQNKEFVVIIDFIGNYNNNYMIPMALFGDRSYNKDNVRKAVREGTRVIPGSSSIHFDEISRKRIYESIDTANFSETKIIKEAYQQLKFKLGRIPELMDFEEHGSIDVLRIFENKSFGSYYGFLKKYEKEYKETLTPIQQEMLQYMSVKFAPGKRIHELMVLKDILRGERCLLASLKKKLEMNYQLPFTVNTKDNIVNVLTGKFLTGTGKDTYKRCIFIQKDEINQDYRISAAFQNELLDREFRRLVEEIVEYGMYRNRIEYLHNYKTTPFNLYKKYTYEDVCRLLEWEKAEVALNIGGYKYDRKTNTYPVFINYEKDNDISDTIKYEDRFENRASLIAISKSGRTIQSEDVQKAVWADEQDIKMDLFIRKNKDDSISKEFYYFGRIHATGMVHQIQMLNTNKTSVEIQYRLDVPVREDMYDYIVN